MTWWAPAAVASAALAGLEMVVEDRGTSPARELDGGVTDRTCASGDQHHVAGQGTGMQPRRAVLRHCKRAVGGHRRYSETGTDVEARAFRKAYDPDCGQVRVLLGGPGGPLVPGEIHPDAIPYSKVGDALPDCVDDTSTVLIRSYLRERRRRTVAGAEAGLPVSWVDTGDDDADTDLARRRLE